MVSKITKTKAEFRIKQIEIQENTLIDTIIIKYDDAGIWSYGLGGEKTYAKTIIFTENEYLVRVTHETLESKRWAGASLELETNKGRVFSFEPDCSWLPKDERTTIIADTGMEIVSLKIKLGELVEWEQQPCVGEGRWAPDKAWYNVLYCGIKEEEEEIEKKEFHKKAEADAWWRQVSDKSTKKQGRGALYLDSKENKILKMVGSTQTTERLVSAAEEQGLYLNMKNENKKVALRELLSAILKSMLNRGDFTKMMLIIVLTICSNTINLEIVRTSGQLISFVSGNQTETNHNIYANMLCQRALECSEGSRYHYGRSMLICFILMILLESAVSLAELYVSSTAERTIEATLSMAASEKALSLDQAYHDSHDAGDVAGASSAGSVVGMILWTIPRLVTTVFHFITIGFYLVAMNPVFGGTVVLVAILYNVFYVMPISKDYKKISARKYLLGSQASSHHYEALGRISTVKQFSKERFHLQEQKKAEAKSVESSNRYLFHQLKMRFTSGVFHQAVLAAMMLYEITAEGSHFKAGEFMTMYMLVGMFLGTFESLTWDSSYIQSEVVAIERFADFMATPIHVVSGKESVGSLEGDIKFEGVHFNYPTRPGEKVLSGLDLTIQRNKMTAIVGDSGSGKSTLAKLLMRLYDPLQGRITFGGKDIKRFDVTELHGKMAIVSQNPDLLDTTLSDNIAYGSASFDQITTPRIKAAAQLANCDFIEKFRSGMETFAGDQGLQISGGQKQRIAIARAAMRDPDILILDEATSSLDAQNEQEVQEALDKLMSNKTTIVIAHRLSTIQNADEILVLKDGKVIERGTHEQLMNLHGYYSTLVSKQLVKDTVKETVKKLEESTDLEVQKVSKIMRQASETLLKRHFSKPTISGVAGSQDGVLEDEMLSLFDKDEIDQSKFGACDEDCDEDSE